MPKLENFTTHIKINGIPYAKNTLNYQGDDIVSIYYLNDRDARVIGKAIGRFSDWTDLNNISYSSEASLKSDLDSFLYTIVLDPLAKAKGTVAGVSQGAVAGINRSIQSSGFLDVWGHTSDLVFPTAGEQWEVVSDSTNDKSGGTGAKSVVIFAMNDSFIDQSEIITMNGTTPVATDKTDWFKPGQTLVALSGSGQWNEGTITIRVAGGGDVRGVILPKDSRTFSGFRTVPAGKTMFITQASVFVPFNNNITIINRIKIFGTNTWLSGGEVDVYQSGVILPFKSLPSFPEKTDIRMTAISTNDGVRTSEQFEFDLVDGSFPIATAQNMML